jgi:hypothetical protein
MLSLLASISLMACGGVSEGHARGHSSPSIYEEWVGAEETGQHATRASVTSPEDEKPINAPTEPRTPNDELMTPPERERRVTVAPPAAPEAPRDTVSDVGHVFPLEVEREEAPAPAECVCPVEPSIALSPEIMREMDERTRYRHPEGTAARVAGGPPDGFERPPGSAAVYGHAWVGGFERAPGTADKLSAR